MKKWAAWKNQMSIKVNEKTALVNNNHIHYLECGLGDPIVFIHGIPTSSHLWLNIISDVARVGRCIVPDLIGCGQSDQPDLSYRVNDYIEYFEKFIETLQLKDIILVMHAWGSVVGFDYARRNPNNVKGLIFYESHLRPSMDWDTVSLPVKQIISLLRSNSNGKEMILNSDYYMDKIFPLGFMHKLPPEELAIYKQSYLTERGRKLIWQYLRDLPLGEINKGAEDLIKRCSAFLQKTKIPKLMLYAIPGFITTIDTVLWADKFLPNISIVELDEALHYAQETCPLTMADEIVRWYHRCYTKSAVA